MCAWPEESKEPSLPGLCSRHEQALGRPWAEGLDAGSLGAPAGLGHQPWGQGRAEERGFRELFRQETSIRVLVSMVHFRKGVERNQRFTLSAPVRDHALEELYPSVLPHPPCSWFSWVLWTGSFLARGSTLARCNTPGCCQAFTRHCELHELEQIPEGRVG